MEFTLILAVMLIVGASSKIAPFYKNNELVEDSPFIVLESGRSSSFSSSPPQNQVAAPYTARMRHLKRAATQVLFGYTIVMS
ncbi:hypothetical protein HOLleu_22867 [Holothuria leucospilota]|uniref:Uncharacterized protein n=1 Tax=Holothuria leucospilota TaxID=206669 RepID=A0A9Q1BUH5_HOLLE|nr:hypothetical protein HOLleu_22867 [Holothuria leucospilota]